MSGDQHPVLGPGAKPYVAAEDSALPIVMQVERMAAEHADDPAVTDGAGVLTYGELNAHANRLAHTLLGSHPGGAEDPVAFLVGHDRLALVAMLGILKAGRPYVALHPANPIDRLRGILQDAGATCIISTRVLTEVVEAIGGSTQLRVLYLEDLDRTEGEDNPGIYVSGDAPFCINYTSGTTGEPKGLFLTHGNAAFDTFFDVRDWEMSDRDRTSLVFFIGFGAGYPCVLTALLTGGTLCMFDFAQGSPEAALDWVQRERITILRLTPSMWRALFARAPEDIVLSSVRIVSLGGEAARVSDFALFKQRTRPGARFQNQLASSEAGDVAQFLMGHETEISGENLPVGRPVPGHELILLDDDDQPVAAAEAGEIVIRSRHLHAGYWRQPELTAERYVSDALDPTLKTLHTGDLGRWLPSGMLEYLGRKDSIVKIRGYRVVLSEIEFHLLSSGLVGQAAVVPRALPHLPGQMQLVGYVSPRTREEVDLSALRAHLASKLPAYSIPAVFVVLAHLPLNPNGKVDRQALPEPPERLELTAADLPADALEEKLARIWSSLLQRERLSVHDNFFELGGDSLSVLSMMLDAEKLAGWPVPREFFRNPTLRNLTLLLRQPPIADEDAAEDEDAGFDLAGADRASEALRLARRDVPRAALITARAYARRLKKSVESFAPFAWAWSWVARRRTFARARALVLNLADRRLLLEVLYPHRKRLLRRYLRSLGVAEGDLARRFRHSFISNLAYRLVHEEPRFFGGEQAVLVRDYRRLAAGAAMDEVDALFPVAGLEHVQRALREGRGVILVSFHGAAAGHVLDTLLARRLGSTAISTLTQRAPEAQGAFSGRRELMQPAVAGSVYAELAYYGQLLLRQGKIVELAGDTFAPGPGPTYLIAVGDRRYEIKPGFAELALNSGAPVIPNHSRFLEDGRVLTEFEAPLDPGRGTREQQVQALVNQYEHYLNHVLSQYPEMRQWKTMATHLRRARWEPRRSAQQTVRTNQ